MSDKHSRSDDETLVFRTKDQESVKVSKRLVAEYFMTIRQMIELNPQALDIPLLTIDSKVLSKIVEYIALIEQKRSKLESIDGLSLTTRKDKDYDSSFFQSLDQGDIFDIIMAANYLDCQVCFDSACRYVASLLSGKSADDIRKEFNIKCDLTPEELQKINEENQFCDHL